ncbi:hypothetical protein J1G42_18645 [Cellulomonas sp. zg-ZUI222]|uniref:alpha/beta hydrolase n=1 Tax=Cellulomonas TaxID=1707 RepID=UPI001A94BFF9|nr:MULTISPECIES: hypothetical protein [Cellulomonas]MBO0901987.1 hypothetical protein [Cellulomonas sp. zg-ZUI22]MBO0922843.1 hypothetical protein [Cellulomonas wangleii]
MRLRPVTPSTRPHPAGPRLAALTALTVAALAACSTGTEPPVGEVGEPAAAQTPTMLESAPVVMAAAEAPECLSEGVAYARVGPEESATGVAWAGAGDRGVLLAPQVDGDVCQWSAEVARLAGAGYLVATYDWGTSGEAGFRSALDVLHATGAQDVAFVGASAGGTLAAGLADDLGAVAVVALSPPAQYGEVDARAEANAFTGPLQVFSSTDDPQVPAADSALVVRNDKTSIVTDVSGTAHGIEFMAPDGYHADHVRSTIDEALTQGFGEG